MRSILPGNERVTPLPGVEDHVVAGTKVPRISKIHIKLKQRGACIEIIDVTYRHYHRVHITAHGIIGIKDNITESKHVLDRNPYVACVINIQTLNTHFRVTAHS